MARPWRRAIPTWRILAGSRRPFCCRNCRRCRLPRACCGAGQSTNWPPSPANAPRPIRASGRRCSPRWSCEPPGESDVMKTYRGGRSLDGAVVTVDGSRLPPRYDLKRLSSTGFEWTYEGAGPAQLALALLADHLADDNRALALYDAFMKRVVAELDNSWELTSADIDATLAELGG